MLTNMLSCHTRGQHMVRQSHEDVHMVHQTSHWSSDAPEIHHHIMMGIKGHHMVSVGYMGICMWNTGNMENTDYGQMGITEDYLMWFSFMYGLQSDYYLVLLILLIPMAHYLYLVWSGHLFVSCLSFHSFSCDFRHLSDFAPCHLARAHPYLHWHPT